MMHGYGSWEMFFILLLTTIRLVMIFIPTKGIKTGQIDEGIFSDDALLNTHENRQKILKLVNDKQNRVHYQKEQGIVWYSEIQPDGSQLWASVKINDCKGDGAIRSCGLNRTQRSLAEGHDV